MLPIIHTIDMDHHNDINTVNPIFLPVPNKSVKLLPNPVGGITLELAGYVSDSLLPILVIANLIAM